MKDPIIQIKKLTKAYPPSYALKEIDLSIFEGEIFGIIGMSGAGKSTLIRCLTSLEKPTKGEIFLGDEELTALSERRLRQKRKKIGMIFQHFNLFSSRRVIDNVAYPLEISGISLSERQTRARELLDLVGIKAKENHYPAQISGGEKQRVAIARALANQPDVLLCDEATSALDPRTTQSILTLLAELNQKLSLTIVLITHEMEVIKQICTHVAVLEHGEIVEKGTTTDLFTHPKHPTTRQFLQNLTHELPKDLLPKGKESEFLRLSFRGVSASQPIISRLIREYQVEVNILLGSIDVLKTETVGNLIIELSGESDERSKARHFLETQGVEWDELC